MPQLLSDVIAFCGDRLFNGAVSIGWFVTDQEKARAASAAFVFHGPSYHGVQQEDVGTAHGHQLIDTATFARTVVRRCYGMEDQPFTLAIAGYGTGKSHLGLTLASLLSAPSTETAQSVVSAIQAADAGIGGEVKAILDEARQPCLVLALNGMQSFDLAAEVTRQIVHTLRADGHDTTPLDDLRPRFSQAASLIRMSNEAVIADLLKASGASSADELTTALDRQDETAYIQVHDFFATRGMPIRAIAGESVRDVIDIAVRDYCGKEKPYRCILILFDEFGKYMEFATVRSQIAGSGVLQDLFEAIQANANSACFVGFIQFELNAYLQRVAPEYKNEILRYVTRYQAANKVYLSTNLETLIASLLQKRKPTLLDRWFDSIETKHISEAQAATVAKRFPQSRNHRLWCDLGQFHTIIRKGCWPLSPYATWCLFYLAAAGKHLQERSALALLGDMFGRFETADVSHGSDWELAAVDLWSEALQQELISSEETGQQGAITHAYASIISRHGSALSGELQRILCAVVLASKLGLQVDDRDEAICALGDLAGVPEEAAHTAVERLQDEYNVLDWDQAFKAFGILGDAVPRSQFLAFVRQRVASAYDEAGKAQLFVSRAASWCELLVDLDCDFAEDNNITTREWRYQAVSSNLNFLRQQIALARDRWTAAIGVDEPRGTIIYTYVEPSRVPSDILAEATRLLKSAARDAGISALPILVVLLSDEDGALGQSLAEYAVLEEAISEEDRLKFGNLVGAHKEKLQRVIREHIDTMLKQRRYATGLREELEATRLSPAGRELFSRIYGKPIPFPFDGFSTARGNAADTCQEFTMELLLGKLDYSGAIAKPAKSKNRAITVLKEAWGIFTKNGDVARRPSHSIVRSITEKWDDCLAGDDKRLQLGEALRQLCRPPHGANIASAGLLLGVFIAPRSEKLVLVHEGQQLAISQCIQNGMFRGKVIDLTALQGIDLIPIGEGSAEWETLLDDWEQCESHLARKSCLARVEELKTRIPVPPALAYREQHLRSQALVSLNALATLEQEQNDAFVKIERGRERQDPGQIAWGVAMLKGICQRMAAEKPAWTDDQIAEVQPRCDTERQAVVLLFKQWLARQGPMSDAPDAVGEFKHRMLHLVGGNLKKLGLDEEYRQLEAHTQHTVKRVEAVVEARQLARDVRSWQMAHADAARITRIAEFRGLKEVATEYARKLRGMWERIQAPELADVRSELTSFVARLQTAEAAIAERASAVWDAKIETEDELAMTLTEVEALIVAYDGIPADLKDLLAMRRALKAYQRARQRLTDESLTDDGLESLAAEVRQELTTTIGDDDLPWTPADTIDALLDAVRKHRKGLSTRWIEALENDAREVETMTATDTNRLYTRISAPPPVLTAVHAKRLEQVTKRVNARLDSLSVEWLVEKFKALPMRSRKEFLNLIREITGDKKP